MIQVHFPDDCSCEFYEGDGDVIGAAISASDWQSLRNGTAAHSFVGFPLYIIGFYIVELTGVIASEIQQPKLQLIAGRMVAGEDGHWAADVLPVEWVAAMASVPAKSIPAIIQHWKLECTRVYDEIDDWQEGELLDPLNRLIVLCQEALSRRTDVVFLCL